MALDVVKSEINKSAEDAAAAIKAEADAEVAKIMAAADAEIAAMNEKEEKRLKEAVERLGRQELSSAELESKKIVLAKKKEILARAFAETLASLESAPAKRTERDRPGRILRYKRQGQYHLHHHISLFNVCQDTHQRRDQGSGLLRRIR